MRRLFILLAAAGSLQAAPFDYSPPKELQLSSPRDFSLYADALLLQAKEMGLETAVLDTNGNVSPITGGNVLGFSSGHSDYDWNPGARLGMNFLFREDSWDIDIAWMWLKVTNGKNFTAPGSGVLIPLWLLPIGVPTSTNQTAHAVWNVNYNILDARMGKWFHISYSFLAHPHFGARIAVIDQHFSIHYGGLFGAVEGAIPHMDNDCIGFGVRGGFDTEWRLGRYWHLFGNIAGALLWTHFQTTQELSQGSVEGYDLESDFNDNTPNLEIVGGAGWGRSFFKDRFKFSAKIAYEFHEWWDMNQLRRFFSGSAGYANDVVSRGNFTLNGFSFRLQVNL